MKKEKIDLLLTNVDFLDENWEMVYGKEIAVNDGVITDIREQGTSGEHYESEETVDCR